MPETPKNSTATSWPSTATRPWSRSARLAASAVASSGVPSKRPRAKIVPPSPGQVGVIAEVAGKQHLAVAMVVGSVLALELLPPDEAHALGQGQLAPGGGELQALQVKAVGVRVGLAQDAARWDRIGE